MKHEKARVVASPSLSFSLSSFLLFLLEDLLWEDWEAPVCPALPEPPPENDEEEEEDVASTLLPHRAQESSCKSTGETPSSTRKLTWSRKYNTAGKRREQQIRGERRDTNNVYNTGLKSSFVSIYKNWSKSTYSRPSCRTSASWLSYEWQFQHRPSGAPSKSREASYSQVVS